MNPPYIVLHKERGQTPLEVLKEWKDAHIEFASLPATYAGRLDPMAQGKLLVLLGDECKKRDEYSALDKEYEIEIVLDLSSDTRDVLGMPTYSKKEISPSIVEVNRAEEAVTGSHTIPYPAFSSKTVEGQPLFMYALAGTLSTISIPEHTETIYKMALIERTIVSAEKIRARILDALSVVPRSDEVSKVLGADFRQDEILMEWDKIFKTLPERSFSIFKYRVTCASGTYMRTLAERFAKELDTSGFALSINRTKIGTYRTLGTLGHWTKEY